MYNNNNIRHRCDKVMRIMHTRVGNKVVQSYFTSRDKITPSV